MLRKPKTNVATNPIMVKSKDVSIFLLYKYDNWFQNPKYLANP